MKELIFIGLIMYDDNDAKTGKKKSDKIRGNSKYKIFMILIFR